MVDDFDYGEKHPDGQYENHPIIEDGKFEQEVRNKYKHEECGSVTEMSDQLAESVARDPDYYSKAYCAGCKDYVPVSEVGWEDGEDWIRQ